MANIKEKLATLIESEGFENNMDFIEAFITDSVCPAICMNDDCEHTSNLEPDQDRGWCDECNTGSMQSGLLLMGLI
jgi:hypothetical protein